MKNSKCLLIIAILNLSTVLGTQYHSALKNSILFESKAENSCPITSHKFYKLDTRVSKYGSYNPSKWFLKYFEEQTKDFNVEIIEDTPDERLANIIFVTKTSKVINMPAFAFDSGDPDRDVELESLAAGPKVDNQLCQDHIMQMLDQLQELQSFLESKRLGPTSESLKEEFIRLVKVLDSFGRYEAGSLNGKNRYYGAYTQCKGSQLKLEGKLVASRYCIVHLDASRHVDPQLRTNNETDPDSYFLSVAVCLPESCHSKSYKYIRNSLESLLYSQFNLPRSIYKDQQLELKSLFCEIDEESSLIQIPYNGKVLIAIIVFWIVTMIISTIFRYRRSDSSANLFDALDLKKSYEDFIGENDRAHMRKTDRVSLDTLNLIKAVGCPVVIFGHVQIMNSIMSVNTLRAYRDFGISPTILAMAGGSVVVDSFFVMTGMIVTYITLKKLDTSSGSKYRSGTQKLGLTKLSYPKLTISFILLRYIRLIPLYYLIFWFKKSVLLNITPSIFWDHGYNYRTMNGACRNESWLSPLIFTSAYKSMSEQCLPFAWSIAGDLFSSLIVSPIIILFTKKPVLAVLVSITICLSSNIAMFNQFDAIEAPLLKDLGRFKIYAIAKFLRSYNTLYTAAHCRVFSVLIGVLAGYVLHQYSKSNRPWPGWMRGFATYVAILVSCTIVVGPALNSLDEDTLQNIPMIDRMFVHSMTIAKLVWSVANAIILLRMVTDWKDNFVSSIASQRFWKILSRLNYPILLIHLEVLMLDIYQQTDGLYWSNINVTKMFTTCYASCLLIASFLYMFFEYPVDRIFRYLIKNNIEAF